MNGFAIGQRVEITDLGDGQNLPDPCLGHIEYIGPQQGGVAGRPEARDVVKVSLWNPLPTGPQAICIYSEHADRLLRAVD